jgi:hypothetical protein
MTRRQKTDFGLAAAAAFRAKYGIPWLTREVLATWMQCSRESVRQIEERALRKIRRAMTPDDWDLLAYIFTFARTIGKPKHNGR